MKSSADYRQILKAELETRVARNGTYSLRAFARDIGLSPASLSLVMNGKQGLSRTAAARIAEKIGFSAADSIIFCDLVEREHARSPQRRSLAISRLNNLEGDDTILGLETFKVMSDWYHFAILELTTLKKFQSSPKWIANQLDLDVPTIKAAIGRLKKIGMLEESKDGLRQTVGFLATPSDTPSDALKSYNQQLLRKAADAIYSQGVGERDFSGIVLTLNLEDLEWAKGEIRRFRRSLMNRLEKNPRRDRVYCLGIQLFGLEK